MTFSIRPRTRWRRLHITTQDIISSTDIYNKADLYSIRHMGALFSSRKDACATTIFYCDPWTHLHVVNYHHHRVRDNPPIPPTSHSSSYRPSFHPIGTSAAATCVTPRSVASRLNCAEAFLVSETSSRMPSSLMCFRVFGDMGTIVGPVPTIRRSVACLISPSILPLLRSKTTRFRVPGREVSTTRKYRSGTRRAALTRLRPHQIQHSPSPLINLPHPPRIPHLPDPASPSPFVVPFPTPAYRPLDPPLP